MHDLRPPDHRPRRPSHEQDLRHADWEEVTVHRDVRVTLAQAQARPPSGSMTSVTSNRQTNSNTDH
jgi:hypothetical protein